MVHIIAFMNNFIVEIFFSTDQFFYKTIHPGKVLVIKSYGFITNKTCYNIHNCWTGKRNLIISIKIIYSRFPIKDANCPSGMIRVLSYGDGQNKFKWIFACIIWCWQLQCKEACAPVSISKFGWDLNIKSMLDLDFYFLICESPNWEVRKSSSEPSKLVI